jgi:selenocysteine lyase/cysteine desulfurase
VTAVPVAAPAAFRARFPMLAGTVHLASCSLGARSLDLDAALSAMLTAMAEGGAPWQLFEVQATAARRGFAALVGAHPDQVALLPNATIGAYQVASTRDWSQRRRIVTTTAEFPSLAHVWLAQQARGAQVVFVERDGQRGGAGQEPAGLEDYLAAIDADTALVSVPLCTYRNGARFPVAEVAAAAHEAGAEVMVDAYQAAGVEPVDVAELGCDYLVAGTLKYLLGLPGVAFLYASRPTGRLAPELTGWFGRTDPFAFDPCRLDYPDHARRYETGTPAVPALYAANAGLGLLAGLDPHAVRRHVAGLVEETADRLAEQGERVWLPADPGRRGAQVALLDEDPAALAAWLAARRIAVSPRGPAVRLSYHYYNDTADIDAVCTEIAKYRRESSRCRN